MPTGSVDKATSQHLESRDSILAQLQQNLHKAHQAMKFQADKMRTDLAFEMGDLVLVKLQPYRQINVKHRGNNKLSLKYFGPFPIIARMGAVAYKVQLPPTAKIHPVFHISQLKKFKGNSLDPYYPLPETTSELGPILQPEHILQARTMLKGQVSFPQVLVKWNALEASLATWEDKSYMLDT